jgi:hypothetical protein
MVQHSLGGVLASRGRGECFAAVCTRVAEMQGRWRTSPRPARRTFCASDLCEREMRARPVRRPVSSARIGRFNKSSWQNDFAMSLVGLRFSRSAARSLRVPFSASEARGL